MRTLQHVAHRLCEVMVLAGMLIALLAFIDQGRIVPAGSLLLTIAIWEQALAMSLTLLAVAPAEIMRASHEHEYVKGAILLFFSAVVLDALISILQGDQGLPIHYSALLHVAALAGCGLILAFPGVSWRRRRNHSIPSDLPTVGEEEPRT